MARSHISFRLRQKARQGSLRISILGDSVATYKGLNPPGYAVYYQNDNLIHSRMISPEDCWWMQLLRACGGTLGVNGSYSGSTVSGYVFPAACSQRRIDDLGQNGEPDIILVCVGENDFGHGYEIGFINDPADTPLDEGYFADAFTLMLTRLRKRYPQSLILCRTLARTTIESRCGWVYPELFNGKYPREAYNDAIRTICAIQGVTLLDFAAQGLTYETTDGSHPTWRGHHTYARAWIDALSNLFSCTFLPRPIPAPDYDPPIQAILFARETPRPHSPAREDWLLVDHSGYMRQLHRTSDGLVTHSYPEEEIIVRSFLASLLAPDSTRETYCGTQTPYGGDDADFWEISVCFASGRSRHVWCRRGQEHLCPHPIRKHFAAASMLTVFHTPFPW